jgi:hypothetical protein
MNKVYQGNNIKTTKHFLFKVKRRKSKHGRPVKITKYKLIGSFKLTELDTLLYSTDFETKKMISDTAKHYNISKIDAINKIIEHNKETEN